MTAMEPVSIADVVKIIGISTGKTPISRNGFESVFSYSGVK
jgi:hypothetical protein